MWEPIVAVDEAGNGYILPFDALEVEMEGPVNVTDGVAKITGTAIAAPRWVPELQEWQ